MKLSYLTFSNIDSNDGPSKKMMWQIEALKNYFEKIDFIHFKNQKLYCNNIEGKFSKIKTERLKLLNEISVSVKDSNYIYIRFWGMNVLFIYLLNKIKKQNPNLKIFLEIPTYPYIGEIKTNFKVLSNIKQKVLEIFIKKYIYKIITFSEHKKIFNVDCINISNGISIKNISLKKQKTDKSKI
ncbi:MAG: hypothetical protein ACRCZ2_03105, partial [Fusobacteriaceae bacterium]